MSDDNPYAPPDSDPVVATDSPVPSLWNPDAAGAWSLLFSPIFGSVLLLKNWRTIGREDKLGTARIWLVVSIVMFVLTLFVGGVGLIYIIIWYFAWQKPQSKFVKARWGNDYRRKSWKTPLLIGFGCWVGLFSIFVLVGVMIELPQS